MNVQKIEAFKNREVKAKDVFTIKEVDKLKGYEFVRKFHYLEDAKYFAKYSIGLFIEDELVGVATFANPQGNVALKGWFGLDNKTQDVQELTRLCLLPLLNGSNATSYLLSNAMKLLKRDYKIRAVITLADNHRHNGAIYQVCNFKYYGLTDKKTDFYRKYEDGSYKKNPRGATKGLKGVWTPRSRKHRYAFIMDKSLECLYTEKPRPQANEFDEPKNCPICLDTLQVHDTRLGDTYTCPECTGDLKEI